MLAVRRPLSESGDGVGGVVHGGGSGRGPDGFQSQAHVDVGLTYSLHLLAALLDAPLAGCQEPLSLPGRVGRLAHLSV